MPEPAVANPPAYLSHSWETAAPLISQYESGNSPLLGWKNTDLSGYPLTETGFPDWKGLPGPAGRSTAAGLYQITQRTWDPIARQLGIHDFSEASQRAVAQELFRQSGYAPWAPYNPRLAAAIGWQGASPSSLPAATTADSKPLLAPIQDPPVAVASAGGPLGADVSLPPPNWQQNMNLGLLLALATPKYHIQPVYYDPFAVMPSDVTAVPAAVPYTTHVGSKSKFTNG